jgi:hypothetical protein
MMSVSHYFLLINIDNGDGGQPAVVELDHPLEPGQWYHLAVTFTAKSAVQIFRQGVKSVFSGLLSRGSDRPENGSDAFKDPLQIHLNGRLVYEGQQVYPRYVFNQALGKCYVGFNFDGQIGPVRILSTPMSCEGIQAMASFQIKDSKHSAFLEDGAIDKKIGGGGGGVKRKTVVSIHPQSHLGSLLVDEKSLDRYAYQMPNTLAWQLGNARHALESAGG